MRLLFLHLVLTLLVAASASDDDSKQLVPAQERELASSAEFYIVHTGSNKVIDVSGGLCDNGNSIHLWTRDGTPAQRFRFGPNNSIINVGCNKVLDVSEGDCMPGTKIQLYDPDGTDAQRWEVKSNGAIESTKCQNVLEVFSSNDSPDGTTIWLGGNNDTSSQKWAVEYTQDPLSRNAMVTSSPWEGPLTAPLVGAAAAALPDGRVLLWSSGGKGQTWTSIFDPSTKRFSRELVSTPGHNMFCPGISWLGDGRVMVSGGSNSERTTFYDPVSNMWAAGPPMAIPRGYHSHVTLSNGSVLTIGGSWSGGVGNKHGELYQSYRWHRKPGIRVEEFLNNDVRSSYRDFFFWLFQAPDGRVFHAGPSTMMHWIDVEGKGSTEEAGSRGGDGDAGVNGNAVMYDIGKILVVGGAKDFASGIVATAHSHTIDINTNKALVKRVGNMAWRRTFANSIVLPTGEVVVIGGATRAAAFSDADTVFTAEIWSPRTGQWTRLTKMKVPRNYHSTALLTKDGRIVAAGGGLCGSCAANHPDVEIFTPPYLLNANGSPKPRPTIRNGPEQIQAGDDIRVNLGVNTPGARFSLIRSSTVTHSTNADQRRIPLKIIKVDGNGWFTLQVPDNDNVVIAGNYFLFAMNGHGTPSVALSVRVSPFFEGLGDPGTWRQVHGWASDIGAGAGGVAVIGGGRRIYRLDSSGNRWHQLPGSAVQVAVGDAIFVANRHNTAYELNGRWHSIPNIKAKDIGSFGTRDCVIRDDSRILCRTGSGGFHALPGSAERIDVCPNGRPVVVNKHGTAYWYNGSKWTSFPGKFTDIACGPDGVIWTTGRAEGVYRWLGSIWEKIPGEGVRISVDKNGIPWTITGFGEIYQYEPNGIEGNFGRALDIGAGKYGVVVTGDHDGIWKRSGHTWNKLPGLASEVAVGDDTVFVVNRHKTAYEFGNGRWAAIPKIKAKDIGSSGNRECVIRDDSRILCRTGSGGFHALPGSAERIDVCPNGRPVVVNKHGTAYWYNGSAWVAMPEKHMDIACGPDNVIWTIGGDGGLNRWHGSYWEQLPGRGRRISVDDHGTPWVVTSFGRVYEYNY